MKTTKVTEKVLFWNWYQNSGIVLERKLYWKENCTKTAEPYVIY